MSTKLISQALASSGGGGELPRVVAFFLAFFIFGCKSFLQKFFSKTYFLF